MEYRKITDSSLEITVQETTVKTNIYSYDFLTKQKADIEKQRDEYVAARNKEIAEVVGLLAKCKELGITSRVKEVV